VASSPDRISPSSCDADASWHDGPPDPLAYPGLYDGVILRRVMGYIADQVLVTLLSVAAWLALAALQILTLGLVAPVPAAGLVLVIGFGYYTYFLGSQGATLGMAWTAVEVRGADGRVVTYGQAFLRTALFYLSIALTAWLILFIAFLNPRRRCAHDFLAETVVIRKTQ
jgi:uncharacterized RDD family membrane protein YckC